MIRETGDTGEFLDAYLRVTRRARAVVERVFGDTRDGIGGSSEAGAPMPTQLLDDPYVLGVGPDITDPEVMRQARR